MTSRDLHQLAAIITIVAGVVVIAQALFGYLNKKKCGGCGFTGMGRQFPKSGCTPT